MKMCVCNKSAMFPYCDGSHNKKMMEESKGTPFVVTKKEDEDE